MSINVVVIMIDLKLFTDLGIKGARTGLADWADGNDASSGSALGTLLILESEGFDSEAEDIYKNNSSLSEKSQSCWRGNKLNLTT
jgi:hypothetical protein